MRSDAHRKLPPAPHEYLYEHPREKHGGVHADAVETGYNHMGALRKHDPTKSLVDVDAECARGAQFAISSSVATQCELGAVVDVDMFKTKLHVRLVKRADNFDLKALLKFRAPPEQSGGDAAPAEA